MLRVWIRSVTLGVGMAVAAAAQTPVPPAANAAAKPAEEARPKTPAERESARLLSISEWAKKTGATREQVEQRVFAPIIAGNQSDAEKNRDAAISINKKAEETAKAGDAQGAKKLRAISELFAECAKGNQHFLQSYKSGDMKGARDALNRLRALDDRIAEVAGQRVPRSWYAHEYMVATMGMNEAEATRWVEQQFLGRTLPAGPAANAPQARK
jgi:hypothetical protein